MTPCLSTYDIQQHNIMPFACSRCCSCDYCPAPGPRACHASQPFRVEACECLRSTTKGEYCAVRKSPDKLSGYTTRCELWMRADALLFLQLEHTDSKPMEARHLRHQNSCPTKSYVSATTACRASSLEYTCRCRISQMEACLRENCARAFARKRIS